MPKGELTTRLHLILAIVAILLVVAHPVGRDAFAVVAAKHFRWAWHIGGGYRAAASVIANSSACEEVERNIECQN